ncbi:hypothetical protein NIASO_20720 [Niabella soli DSM 19437]|uniref:Uncharacterized protein n=1 Tax=Niabella soli DSM 19437 TaxID=929713 RepID=W0F9F9_9BACT|nr:hypothetical protein NIASO_20720 [Niabella soli DSM 19437]
MKNLTAIFESYCLIWDCKDNGFFQTAKFVFKNFENYFSNSPFSKPQ